MAILDTIGSGALVTNGQQTVTGYIVESQDSGDADIDMEDINKANGALSTRLVFNRDTKLNLNLIALNATDAATILGHFPIGNICTATGDPALTSYYVDSCTISKTKSATRVKVGLTDIGIT
jgi:hypothetical protein